MVTITLCKNIVSCYCDDFAITPRSSVWKVSVHIPRKKLVRTVWMFREKIEKSLSGACSLHMTSNWIISHHCQDKNIKEMIVSKCEMHMQGM